MQIAWVIFSYILGSIPFGLVLSKVFCNIDPRSAGSKSIGATNVARLCGKKYGVMTLVCDALKGAIPVLVATMWDGHMVFVSAAGFAAILGHVFSCFLGFKGGKAIATSVGVYLSISPYPFLVAVACCLFAIWYSGYVSVGSLILVLIMPILLYVFGAVSFVPLSLLIAILAVWTHRENIKRLMNRTEKSWKKSEYKE